MAIIRSGWVLQSQIVMVLLQLTSQLCLVAISCDTTHARGETLDLVMTGVPDLVRVSLVAPIGTSDHSSLSAVISMAQAVPNVCVSREVFLQDQVNGMQFVRQCTICPRITNFGMLTILLRF